MNEIVQIIGTIFIVGLSIEGLVLLGIQFKWGILDAGKI